MIRRLQSLGFTLLAVLLVLVGGYKVAGRYARKAAELQFQYEQARREAAGAKGVRDAQVAVDQLPVGGAAEQLRRDWLRGSANNHS